MSVSFVVIVSLLLIDQSCFFLCSARNNIGPEDPGGVGWAEHHLDLWSGLEQR